MLLLSSMDEYLNRESRVVGEIVKWRKYIYTSWSIVYKIATDVCQTVKARAYYLTALWTPKDIQVCCVSTLLLRITGMLAIAN